MHAGPVMFRTKPGSRKLTGRIRFVWKEGRWFARGQFVVEAEEQYFGCYASAPRADNQYPWSTYYSWTALTPGIIADPALRWVVDGPATPQP